MNQSPPNSQVFVSEAYMGVEKLMTPFSCLMLVVHQIYTTPIPIRLLMKGPYNQWGDCTHCEQSGRHMIPPLIGSMIN